MGFIDADFARSTRSDGWLMKASAISLLTRPHTDICFLKMTCKHSVTMRVIKWSHGVNHKLLLSFLWLNDIECRLNSSLWNLERTEKLHIARLTPTESGSLPFVETMFFSVISTYARRRNSVQTRLVNLKQTGALTSLYTLASVGDHRTSDRCTMCIHVKFI